MSIKVASYNLLIHSWVHGAKPILKDEPIAERETRLVRRMAELDADLICTQEVQKADSLMAAMKTKGYSCFHSKRNNDEDEGCAIFYRTKGFQVQDAESCFINDGTGRMVQKMRLRMEGCQYPFSVLNTHIIYDPKKNAQEFAFLQKTIEGCMDSPVLVCGDLNVTPKDSLLDGFYKLGLKDPHGDCAHASFIHCGGADPHDKGFQGRIDFTMHTSHFKSTHADVCGDVAKLLTKEEPSDHLPVMASLELVENGPFQEFNKTVQAGEVRAILSMFDLLPRDAQNKLKFGFWLYEGMPKGDHDFGQTFFSNNPAHQIVKDVAAMLCSHSYVVPATTKEEISGFETVLKQNNPETALSSFYSLSAISQRLIKKALWVEHGKPLDKGIDFAGDQIKANPLDPKLLRVVNDLSKVLV